MYSYTGCIVNTGCIVILDVQLYWMYSYTECIVILDVQLYWMYSYTGCIVILDV